MRKLILSMNMTLDGFADHTAGIADDELHDFYADQLDKVGTVLFGRITYQLMESFWPDAPSNPECTKSMIRFANKFNNISKIVFSRTLDKAEWNNTKLIKDNMADEVVKMKQQSGRNISVGGSVSIVQAFMKHKLIDEYLLVVHPIILGSGKRLFDRMNERVKLRLIDTKKFKSGAVALHYLPV